MIRPFQIISPEAFSRVDEGHHCQVVNHFEADVEVGIRGRMALLLRFLLRPRDASTVVARQEVEMKFVQKTNASIAEQVQLIKKKAPSVRIGICESSKGFGAASRSG